MTYDAAGNLRDDGLAWHYRYDFENHLTHAEYPPGTTVGTFKYDALGRRIEADDAGEVRRYLYDGQQTIAGYGSTNALLRYFVHGATYIDEHALMRDLGLGQDRYYLLKELYTVAGLANSSGTVTDFYTYDAYGRLIEEPPPECTGLGELSAPGPGGESAGPAEPAGGPVAQGGPIGIDPSFECVAEPDPSNPEPPPPPADCQGGFGQFTLESGGGSTPPPDNPFYFTGQRLDRLGDCWRPMYDYRARSYEPWHGRFLQRDPAGYGDAMCLYLYTRGNPLLFLDPTGLLTIEHLIGRYGEVQLLAAIKANPKYIILHGVEKALSANGPDIIVYNKVDEVFEFFDNKAWARKTVNRVPTWIANFDIEKYREVLEAAIDSGAVPKRLVPKYRAALKAATNDRAKSLIKITPFGGKVTGIGDDLARLGVQFADEQALKIGSRRASAAASKAFCTIPIAGIALEILMNPSVAQAAQPEQPEERFAGYLAEILRGIQRGSRRTWPRRPVEYLDELEVRKDFINRGILRKNTFFGGMFGDEYIWSTDLTEADLDHINEKIGMDELTRRLQRDLGIIDGSKGMEFGD